MISSDSAKLPDKRFEELPLRFVCLQCYFKCYWAFGGNDFAAIRLKGDGSSEDSINVGLYLTFKRDVGLHPYVNNGFNLMVTNG